MPRTRNLQTTNRNVRSPKTMTRPVRPGGTGRRIRPSPMRLPLELTRGVFAVTPLPDPLRCGTESLLAIRASFPPRF